MDATRWEHLQAIFHAAADLPAHEQPAYVALACGADEALADEVLALLLEDARGATILDRGVAHAAHGVLGDGAPVPLPAGGFGPYRIRGLLGEGGMGVVYLAEREDLGSLAAIKILRDAWLSPARRERFASEQRTLAQLDHPSIARLYDADTLPDGTPWFVMEYVDGVPLTEHCRAHAYTIPERLRLFRDVCAAVQHAHRHAIIHRDLKPSNILVRRDGTVKLLDFGISKQMDRGDAPADRTRTGLQLMTPAYAAPEQFRAGRVGVHTDVYALGVMLYELVAGRHPLDLAHRTPADAEAVILEQEPEKPSALARTNVGPSARGEHGRAIGRGSWADLDVICLTAMHRDPHRRYATVDALIRDIDHYLHGEPLEARPDTLAYTLGKFVRRKWRPLGVAALVLGAIVGLVTFYTVRLTIARNTALAEAARAQRIQRFTMSLFEGGDAAAGPADSLRVVTLVDRGVQQARSLDAEPVVQAELYLTLGTIHQKLGNFARADSLLRVSLERRRTLLGPEHPDVAASLVALGALRGEQAEFPAAEQLIREGLGIARHRLPPDHPVVSRAITALGQVLQGRGAYEDAVQVLEEAVQRQSARNTPSDDLASSLFELSGAHFYAGHYAAADSLSRRALALHRELHGQRHPLVAEDLVNLGAIQFELGRYADAERFLRDALDITRSWYGDDHHRTASNLTMLGRALVRLQRYDEAVELLGRALAVQERVHGAAHPSVASALNELGTVALQRGKLDDAEAHFRRMARIYHEVYGGDHYLSGIATSNLASVYLARGDDVHAERAYRAAVAQFARTLSADHLNTAVARVKLGRALLRQRRFAEAEVEIVAGYDALVRQTKAPVSWLHAARSDLAIVYDSLQRPELAARYRASEEKGR